MTKPALRVDLSGKKFGGLAVISFSHAKDGRSFWLCHCDCGASVTTRGDGLKSGHAQSCGCRQKEAVRSVSTRHGMNGSKTYKAWISMTQRATNPNASRAERYVLRGISVCERWRVFENFLEDMGVVPDGMTLERVDNDASYSKENCIWASRAVQNRNRKHRETGLHVGVYRQRKLWAARVSINNRPIYLGAFPTYEEAVEARKQGELKYYKGTT